MAKRSQPAITVKVTAALLAAGRRRNARRDPLIEAIHQAYPGATFLSVDLSTIRFTDRARGRRYTYLTPRRAQLGMMLFDNGLETVPYSFALRRPAAVSPLVRSRHRRDLT